MKTTVLVALLILAGCDLSHLENARTHHLDVRAHPHDQWEHMMENDTYPDLKHCIWGGENWGGPAWSWWCHRE